ncbi:MAG TPA: hypothetical protein VEK06_02440, partial [Myxococcota bacterium]|nr:hypothetical protein [Myxococcota bacterium]
MPLNVYDAIKNHGGVHQNVDAKNRLINAVSVALDGPPPSRRMAITNAINAQPALAGLDIIALLPENLCPPLSPAEARELEVGAACYIPGPNDAYRRKNHRSGILYLPNGYANAEQFVRAIEDRCKTFYAPIQSNVNESQTQKRARIITSIYQPLFPDEGKRFDNIQQADVFPVYLESLFSDADLGRYYKTIHIKYVGQAGIDVGGLLRDFLDRVSDKLKTMFEHVPNSDREMPKSLNNFDVCTVPTQARDKKNCWENIGAMFAKLSFIENQRGTPPGVPHVKLPYLLLNKLVGKNFNDLVDYLATLKLDDPEFFDQIMVTLEMDAAGIGLSGFNLSQIG